MSFFKKYASSIDTWQDKTVWIVGASSGIGKALAVQLSGLGAKVYVSARSQGKLAQLAKQYPNIQALAFDATDKTKMQLAYQTITQTDDLDVVVHAAAMYEPMLVNEFDAEKIKTAMTLNYGSVIDLIGLVLPQMQAKKSGHIGVIASVAGYIGMPNSLAYGASKAALINLCENLYAELASQNIHIKLINPGFVKSPLTDKNSFEMPMIISTDTAASAIIKGFESNKFEIHFPKKFTMFMKALRMLPYSVTLPIIRKMGQATTQKSISNNFSKNESKISIKTSNQASNSTINQASKQSPLIQKKES